MYTKIKSDLNGTYVYLSLGDEENKEICLDISSKMSMTKFYSEREMSYNDVEKVVRAIVAKGNDILSKGESLENMILSPEYIYVDVYSFNVYIIEYPYAHSNCSGFLQELSEYLIERCDHTDRRAVLLSYRFYTKVYNEDFSFARLLDG